MPMPPPHPYPVRCAACEFLYYPESTSDYMCTVCQGSLEDYVRSMPPEGNPTMAWWRRQTALRTQVRAGQPSGALYRGS